mgnify:FL=1
MEEDMIIPEVNLYLAVICQAMMDASGLAPQLNDYNVKQKAKAWLKEDNDEFQYICDIAGIHPHKVLGIYQELLTQKKNYTSRPITRILPQE